MDMRGRIQLVDVVLTFIVLAALIGLAPTLNEFANMVASEADPFTTLLLSLFVPLLFISLLLSIGISARSG